MNAKTYMEQLRKLDKIIEAEMQDIAKWKHRAEGVGSIQIKEKVKSSPGTKDPMADAIAAYVDIEASMKEILAENWAERQKRKETLYKALQAGYITIAEFVIIKKIYLQGQDQQAIAQEENVSASAIDSRVRRGLQGIDAMFEAEAAIEAGRRTVNDLKTK